MTLNWGFMLFFKMVTEAAQVENCDHYKWNLFAEKKCLRLCVVAK